MFINELALYVDYLKKQIEDTTSSLTVKQVKYYQKFITNLLTGIAFYKQILPLVGDGNKTAHELSLFERELFVVKNTVVNAATIDV